MRFNPCPKPGDGHRRARRTVVAGALSAALAGLGLLGVAPRAQAATDLSVPFALGGQNTSVTGASGSSIVAGFEPDLDLLEKTIRPNTKLMISAA